MGAVCIYLCVCVHSYILATTEARVIKLGTGIGTKALYPNLDFKDKRSRSQRTLSAFFEYCINFNRKGYTWNDPSWKLVNHAGVSRGVIAIARLSIHLCVSTFSGGLSPNGIMIRKNAFGGSNTTLW